MDYSALAAELLDNMHLMRMKQTQRHIDESLHGEAFVLKCIARHAEDVLPSVISAEINVSSARVAQTLNSIEKKGLITRRIDADDRRRILVSLTPKGKQTAEAYLRFVIEDMAKMLASLGEKDAKEYVRLTGKLAKAISDNGGNDCAQNI
jgi:DNA-binding MarR family transcriptional regulator